MASILRATVPARTTLRCTLLRHQQPSRPQLQLGRWRGGAAYNPSARDFSNSTTLHVKKYTNDHEWIELSPDSKTGTVGISKYAAKSLGDVVYVELPTADVEAKAGESIGAVESVKSASDILTPVSGTVIEANSALEETPAIINKEPEAGGWIAKIAVADATEVDALMDEEAYAKFTEE
ncbi:MAG: hypothetical protein M1825_003487 [Sarcosagium campestre]|nr:MAG: hypothetical protein M1825_003487 [Sarcosagium campestre]